MAQNSMRTTGLMLVPNSPAVKRQKTAGGYQSTNNSGYNSAADSGDELFEGVVDTPPAKHFTQPTQIIDRSAHLSSPISEASSVVQVPVSSPFRPQQASAPKPAPSILGGGIVASLMAPAGTTYRPPVQRPVARPLSDKKPSLIIDLSSDDDGPQYKGDSSDDGGISRAEIKPSSFGSRSTKPITGSHVAYSGPISSSDKFKDIMASSKFKADLKRPVFDLTGSASSTKMGNAGVQRKPQSQTRPDRAMPVYDINIEDISDVDIRRKVTRLRNMNLGPFTIMMLRNAVIDCKGDVDAAALLLMTPVDVQEISDDDDSLPMIPEPQMKQTLKAPIKSIQERYGSTQNPKRPVQSLAKAPEPEAPLNKPRKRLVQGRRNPSSPVKPDETSKAVKTVKVVKPSTKGLEYDSDRDSYDSGVASEVADDPALETRVLDFLNSCKAEELADLVSIDLEDARFMVSQRPFRSLGVARRVSNASKTKTGKKSNRAPVGDKIVDMSMKMWSGYEAVDALVAECKRLGKPIADEIGKWDFDLQGSAKGGGQGITSMDFDNEVMRDSGIGTPNSKATSPNGDAGEDDIGPVIPSRGSRQKFLTKPDLMSDDVVLKDFQIVGLNWLALLYKHDLSCILADEMGLGKTCQVIAFLAYLADSGIAPGPHLVIVTATTLENWLREFARFCPALVVDPYYGSQAERAEAAERILSQRDEINVVISTYETAQKPLDNKFMRRLQPNVCVYDEGHLLKNPKSLKNQGLMKIPAKMRLLLTGTPLQNNLLELAALLAFILPQVFREHQEELEHIFKHRASTTDKDHAALLSAERIARAKSMMAPFILQRKSKDVLKDLPAKTCRVEYCDLHPSQAVLYNGLRDKARQRAELRVQGVKIANDGENNPLMQARKAAIHPMLFRRHFTDDKLLKMLDTLKRYEPSEFSQPRDKIMQEMQNFSDFYLHHWCRLYPSIAKFDVADLSWMHSGKVEAVVRLLDSYKANGDRVLIFSQFTLVLDILEEVLQTARIQFSRFDGATKVNERQTIIDNFRDDEQITAFLLSTGAGGTGVNLAFVNKVIIFDSSFNPHDDVQAEKRAHRLGQTRPVEVVRLVTKGTIEEQIYALGQSKLILDRKVTGAGDISLKGEKLVAEMMLQDEAKADASLRGNTEDEGKATGAQIGEIIESKEKVNSVADEGGKRKTSLAKRAKQRDVGNETEE